MSLGSDGGRFVRLWRCCLCHWKSRPQEGGGIAQAWATWPEGALAPNGTMNCRSTEYPRWRHRQWGQQQFCSVFKLDKYAMFSFVMTSGLASDSDKFKIIITLHRELKFWDTGPYKLSFFAILAKIYCPHLVTLGTNGLILNIGMWTIVYYYYYYYTGTCVKAVLITYKHVYIKPSLP